ncbi:hypothetical protein ES703_77565 [subsurface metagenome]
MGKIQDTVTCPVCGRGYPAKFWRRTLPKPWRLGVRQDPGQKWKVLGDLLGPDDLADRGAFEVLRSRMMEGVANWVFKGWLDVRDVLDRVADLKRWGGRWIWHQHVDLPPVLHRVDHGFGWGGHDDRGVGRVKHSLRIGRG